MASLLRSTLPLLLTVLAGQAGAADETGPQRRPVASMVDRSPEAPPGTRPQLVACADFDAPGCDDAGPVRAGTGANTR